MKISEVEIRRFRSIKEARFLLHDITGIVGENNAGKTGVLRALNSVFNYENEKMNFLDKTHQFAPRSNSYIYLKFEDIPPEAEDLKEYMYNKSISIEWMFSYSKNRRLLSVQKGSKKDKISNVDTFLQTLSKYLTYVYISVERTNSDIAWGEGTIFKKLITSFLNRHIKKRDMVSSDIKYSSKRIHDSILCKLEKLISNLYLQNKDINFKIDFPDNLDYSSILNFLQLSINEKGSNYLLQEWGSGTKSLAIIAMYRAFALSEEKNIILGIEEPETNLHPQAQKRFIQSLQTKMNKYEVQTIFSTHSTVLIDELNHQDILLVKRKKEDGRSFSSVITQVHDNFWEKYNIDELAHRNFFHLKNSDFFFAKYVIVCESKTDGYVIEQLLSPSISRSLPDISILEMGGVNNISYPYFLLKELGIPFSVVVDFDFFFDYKNNNERDKSRNKNGFPEYQRVLTKNSTKRKVIDDVFGKDVAKLENVKGYREFFDVIRPHRFYSMMYCLEMDLVCSSNAREVLYDLHKLSDERRDTKHLLVNCARSLKDQKNILIVLESLKPIHLPESYQKIKNALIDDISFIEI